MESGSGLVEWTPPLSQSYLYLQCTPSQVSYLVYHHRVYNFTYKLLCVSTYSVKLNFTGKLCNVIICIIIECTTSPVIYRVYHDTLYIFIGKLCNVTMCIIIECTTSYVYCVMVSCQL